MSVDFSDLRFIFFMMKLDELCLLRCMPVMLSNSNGSRAIDFTRVCMYYNLELQGKKYEFQWTFILKSRYYWMMNAASY